jgi:hypothetical protein
MMAGLSIQHQHSRGIVFYLAHGGPNFPRVNKERQAMFKTRLWFSIPLLTLLAACGQSAGEYSSTTGKKRGPS